MNQNKPLGQKTPEIPQTEPEQTPENLDISIKETPSKSEETKVAKEVAVEPEMVIIEPGEELIQEPSQEPIKPQDQSLDIGESDVGNDPINTVDQAFRLAGTIDHLQEEI